MKLMYAVLFVTLLQAGAVQAAPENAVLVLIDDMGYGDMSAHGNPVLETPNLDALHRESARFTNFAVSPTCGPTRAALLTGKHEFKSSVTHTTHPMSSMDLEATTIAQLFQQKGFATGIFGKWHLGRDEEYGPWFRGFDETLTVKGDYQGSHFDPTLLKNREPMPFKGYRTDILFDEAMTFIEKNRDKPFFCYLPTYSPHSPLRVPEKYSRPYEGQEGVNATFSGMMANVDENIGRLIAKLKALELDSNTLVIVISDNGGTYGVDTWNAGMRGRKGSVWYGGTRAVSLWRCGGLFPAGQRGQMTGHVDVFPTLADLFNLNVEKSLATQLDGDSLLPLLKDPKAALKENRMQVHHRGRWDKPANWAQHKYTHCCVRWNNYQLVRVVLCDNPKCKLCKKIRLRDAGEGDPPYSRNVDHYRMPKHGEWELFDIVEDPYEQRDLARQKPEIVKKMVDHYEAWWADVSRTLNKE